MSLRAESICDLLRLIGEGRELIAAGELHLHHFLDGLARITRAQVAIKMTARSTRRGAAPVITEVYDAGWATNSDRERVYNYVASMPIETDPLCAAAFARGGEQVTLRRSDVISDDHWSDSEVRNDVHRPSGIDDALFSMRRREGSDVLDVLVFKRAWGEPPFQDDERELIDLVHRECGWLLVTAPTTELGLSRRQRDTLRLLLTGASEKWIASSLGLSHHTLHGYVKQLYKKLRVNSRAELMAAFAKVA